MEIDPNTTTYTLVIPSVRPEDAGEYMCRDHVGGGELSVANLIVLGRNSLDLLLISFLKGISIVVYKAH